MSKRNSEDHVPAWKKAKNGSEKSYGTELPKSQAPEQHIMEISSTSITEEDLNKLAARQIKAEMLGDMELSIILKEQLTEAKKMVKVKAFAKRPRIEVVKFVSEELARPLQMTVADYKSNELAGIHYESGHISKKLSKKLSSSYAEERDIVKAIQQHQKRTVSLEKCEYCLDRIKKCLIVDIGEQIFLCLPNYQTITEGHCLIVPKNHVSSFLFLDENEWSEVNDFKCRIRKMFMSDKKSVIFMETSMNFKYYHHAVLECIPVPEEDGDMAPFYFKKAIQESEAMWAHNKKLIDLKDKGLRHSVPKNLPYFHVEFDPKVHAGYAHVIEEEKYFPRNFGKEILGGMLNMDYHHLYKNKTQDPLRKSKEVVKFQKKWKS